VNFELRELRQDDGCNALSLGDPALTPLKTFLRKEAKKLHQSNLARTFVIAAHGQTKVMAYVTTICTQISVEQFQEPVPIESF
jgi:ABC-type sugar transport system ATPase subunit